MSDWIALEKKYLFPTYRRFPVVFVRGKGAHLWDEQGKKYIDFFSGLAVTNLGHAPPALAQAVAKQSRTLWHTSNLYYTSPQITLAQMLVERSFKKGKVFFCNSGAEANEAALKLVRKWAKESGRGNEVIAFRNSFHGRTLGALSLTGQEKYRGAFEPLIPGVHFAKFNDIASVENAISDQTCAIFVEPIQGEGGVHPATPAFLRALKKLCEERRMLLIFDEVQSGIGRTGKLFSWQHWGVIPDVIAIAKGLGGGLPIGAVIAQDYLSEVFSVGDHGSTFAGGAIPSVAALAVLKTLSPQFLKTVARKGHLLLRALEEMRIDFPDLIVQVRGLGLLVGVELAVPGSAIVQSALERGLIINCTQEKVLRFLPPLVISEAELRRGLKILRSTLSEIMH